MFTGLIETVGTIDELRAAGAGKRLVVRCGAIAREARIGESIAVSGCCLTVVAADDEQLEFEAGPETLLRTKFGELVSGSSVNLERSLRLGERLGGHLVTGHVDGIGTLESRRDEGDWSLFWFRSPAELSRQMAGKGSIAVDGVSLTLVDVEPGRFSLALIPHTLAVTTLGNLRPGGRVNLETDLLAKYVETQLRMSEGRAFHG